MALFLTDNVIFTILFIVYLIALSRMLAAAQKSTFNQEYQNSSDFESTTDSAITPQEEISPPGILSSPPVMETPSFGIATSPPSTPAVPPETTSPPETPESDEPITSPPEISMPPVATPPPETPISPPAMTSTPEVALPTERAYGGNKIVKIALIFEQLHVVPWFDLAVEYLNKKSNMGLEFKAVSKFPANRSDDAVGLITKLCRNMDALASNEESKPDVVMDFTVAAVPSESVKVVMRTLKIPTVSTSVGQDDDVREWSSLSKSQERYLIRIQPPMDVLDQAIRSVSELQNLSNAVIFFQDGIEVKHKYKSILKDVPVKHKLATLPKKLTSKTIVNFNAQMQMLSKMGYTNYFLVGTSKIISQILPLVNEYVEKSLYYSWFTISTDTKRITCEGCKGISKLVSLFPKYNNNSKSEDSGGFLAQKIDGNDTMSLRNRIFFDLTIDAAMAVGEQKLERIWPENMIGKIPCVNYDLKGNYSDVYIDLLTYFEDPSNLHGTYSISRNGKHHSFFEMYMVSLTFIAELPTMTHLGTWKAGFTGKDLIRLENPNKMNSHVSNKVYRVVTVVNPPFVYRKSNCSSRALREQGNVYGHCYFGYSIDVMDSLSRELNFNYTIFETKGYGYLNENPNIGWNGTIRILMDGRADIALGALTHMPERERVVDFTRRYHPMVGFQFVMQKPKVSANLFKFMMVLERDVWWCILGAYFFTSFICDLYGVRYAWNNTTRVLLWIFDKFSPSSYRNNKELYDNESDEPVRFFDLRECLWFCFTSLTPQGGGEAPKGLSGRLVASTWWLFSFIIIASYTANMAAFLTVSRLAKPIMNLDDLITQHRVQYSAVIGSSAWVYFDRMANVEQIYYEYWRDQSLDDSLSDFNRSKLAVWTYPISDKYTKLWQSMVTNKPPLTFSEGEQRALYVNPKHPNLIFALIGEETDLKYLTMIHCTLETIGEGFSKRSYAIAVQKGSPLKEQFNAVLQKMEDTRELEKIYDDWWNRNPFDKKCKRDYRIEDGINFENLGGIWIVMVVGLICSVIAVLVEIILFFLNNRIQRFKTKISVFKDQASSKLSSSWTLPNREKTDFDTDYGTKYSDSFPQVAEAN